MPQLETKPLFELGTWVGRRQGFGLVASKCSFADAVSLKHIRETKQYKGFGYAWEGFCKCHLGISRANADRIILQLEEFGAAYFELSKIVRIPTEAFRDIAGSVSEEAIEFRGESIPIKKENGRRIQEVVRVLRQDAQARLPTAERRVVQKLRRRLNACYNQLAEMDPALPEVAALIASSMVRLGQLSQSLPQQHLPAA